jgi:hypothetical protein
MSCHDLLAKEDIQQVVSDLRTFYQFVVDYE